MIWCSEISYSCTNNIQLTDTSAATADMLVDYPMLYACINECSYMLDPVSYSYNASWCKDKLHTVVYIYTYMNHYKWIETEKLTTNVDNTNCMFMVITYDKLMEGIFILFSQDAYVCVHMYIAIYIDS